MADVEFIRQELIKVMPKYQLIRDILEGELAVKAASVKYLPIPNNETEETSERYQAYLTRAVLYNATNRTVSGLVGQIFLRDPVVEIPDVLQIVNKDANAANMSLTQMAKMACNHVIAFGRGGLFTDFTGSNGESTRSEVLDGTVRPTINFYKPWNIINWKRTKIKSRNVLSLVVLLESKAVENQFKIEYEKRFRVLRLVPIDNDDFIVVVQIWSKEGDTTEFKVVESYTLADANGESLNELPFDFIGSKNNDDSVDDPPIYDLASLNIAHYRNSADFEESCFMLGQPTPFFAGLTEHWVENVMKGKVFLGSRAAVSLPEKGSAGLLQADPNTLARDAMDHKENLMYSLGAKLVQERVIEATATEIEIQNASENSVLSTAAKNVTTVFEKALQRAAVFIGASTEEVKFKLNTNFDLTSMTPDELRIVLEGWVNFNAFTTSEMREAVQRSGLATLALKEFETQILKDKKLKDALGMNETKEGTQSGSDNRSTVGT